MFDINTIFNLFKKEFKEATRLFFLPLTTFYNSFVKNVKTNETEISFRSATKLFFSPFSDVYTTCKKEITR